ncbi:MAG: hypothetical protein ACP5GZ_00120 [Vulcanisaeta sp.]
MACFVPFNFPPWPNIVPYRNETFCIPLYIMINTTNPMVTSMITPAIN